MSRRLLAWQVAFVVTTLLAAGTSAHAQGSRKDDSSRKLESVGSPRPGFQNNTDWDEDFAPRPRTQPQRMTPVGPGTAAAPYIPTNKEIVISAPPHTDLTFALVSGRDRWERKVAAGTDYKFKDDREWYVEFSRTAKGGVGRYHVEPGSYRFGVGEQGWDLFRKGKITGKSRLGLVVNQCEEGIHVTAVIEGSAATSCVDSKGETVTIEPGDHVVTVNGDSPENLAQYLEMVKQSPKAITLVVNRQGKLRQVKGELAW